MSAQYHNAQYIECDKINQQVLVVETIHTTQFETHIRKDTCSGAKICEVFGLRNNKLLNLDQITAYHKIQCPIFRNL